MSPGEGDVNFIYEYDFDERGNWIERREIRMIRSMGHFISTQGTVFRRILEYRE
jgi:ABC-type taurine transport system ATPase subunit